MVRLLNDRFGIQVRGGWSCASTYSHHLFDILEADSKTIISDIENKNLTAKPGWVRLSLHPTLANKELKFICDAIKKVVINIEDWRKDYSYKSATNEFDFNKGDDTQLIINVKAWFDK